MQSRRRDTEVLIAFATRMKAARHAAGLSQEALGHASDLHRTYIANVEKGEIDLSFTRALRIARALEVPLDDFAPR